MKTPLPLCLALLLPVTVALADHHDDDRRHEGPRVILYQHADFSGGSLVLYPGDTIENMSGAKFDNGVKLNDSISAIRVENGAEAYAYEDSRYRGDALRLTENARDLTGRPVTGSVAVSWNDRISSIKVERVRGRDRDDRGSGRPGGDPDKIIKATFTDLLGREPDAGELRDFRNRMKDQGWTERMVRDHLRAEERYRNEAAEFIVRRAYREVLNRDVDPSGLKQYSWTVREKGWTESDVRDDLRKSAEYRNLPRK